jgi:hypothetical protein
MNDGVKRKLTKTLAILADLQGPLWGGALAVKKTDN